MTIAECPILFDQISEQDPDAGSNVLKHFPDSEMGIANFLNGLPLSKKQQDVVVVLIPTSDFEENEQLSEANNILANAKRQKTGIRADWIACT